MKLVRSLITIVLAIALIFAIFLLWRKYSREKFGDEDKTVVQDGNVIATVPVDMGPSPSSDGISFTVKITEAQLAVLVEDALEKKIEVDDVGVQIGDGGVLAVSFSAGTQDLAELLVSSGKELPSFLKFGISLLGESIEIDIAATVAAEGGKIRVEPTAFGIMGLSVGASGIPDAFTDDMNREINNYVEDNIGKVDSIATKDKVLIVSGSLKTP